jgi:hypothetical protein
VSRVAASFPRSSLRSSLEKLAAIYYRLKIVATCYCNLRIFLYDNNGKTERRRKKFFSKTFAGILLFLQDFEEVL